MRTRISLMAVPVVLLVWFGIGAYLVQKRQFQLGDAAQASRNLAHAFEENIRRSVEAIDTTIRALRSARAHEAGHFDLAGWERDSGLTRDLTLQLSISDRTGTVIASNLGPVKLGTVTPGPVRATSASIADRPHFQGARDLADDTLLISTPVLGRLSGRWSVQFVRKLFDAGGGFDGVVVASLDPSFLSRFYKSLHVGEGALLLLGADGIVRSGGPQTVAGLGTDLSATLLMQSASAQSDGTVRMRATADRIERIYSWRRVEPYGLLAVVGLATADALKPYYEDLRGSVAIGLGLTAATLVISFLLAHTRRDSLRSQTMLRAAVDNISQGLIVIDEARRVPVLNARAVELLELPPHLSEPGFDFDTLLEWQLDVGEFAGQDDGAVRTLVESGGIERGNAAYRRARRNGTVLEVRTKVLESGSAVRTFTDVTDQVRASQVLAEARDTAEAAVHARSELLAVMTHEIRTPLNGVIGVAGLLESMELGPVQREYVRLIRQSGDHLLELINDILDFSRLEAERVELEEVVIDPRALIQGVVDMFSIQAGSKGLLLSAIVSDTLPVAVAGDPGRLRQVLINLVGNAVKFTEQGWVTLSLTHEPETEGRVRLLFSVADSGIGIAPDAIDRMFQEFTQMDGSISRRFGGSGLGLAISRRLAELMGGSLLVESEPKEGSTFRFEVAVKLAEDNPTNRLVAARLLDRLGHRADAVCTGLEAIAALERTRYDLILMDVMMPEMDGLTATRRIRMSEADGTRIPIVGLTAGVGADRLAACLDAGMDAVTTKPVTLARLRSAIAEGCKVAGTHVGAPGAGKLTPRLRELADMLGEEVVAEIVRTFADDTQANLAGLREAASRDDRRMIARIAHSVAGAGRNVGADALALRASGLEETVGTLSVGQIAAEIAVMQVDLEATLGRLGIEPAVGG
jgi:signal transduction histidine kinase/CheY-like chemotaxis protein/HPt (histidine-containing phosphotransfer) domain-containing protein